MYPIADMHCDTISCKLLAAEGRLGFKDSDGHINLEKLRQGGSLLQCFAVFIAAKDSQDNPRHLDPYIYYKAGVSAFYEQMRINAGEISPVRCIEDIRKNREAGKLSALLTVEDGVPLEGNIGRVDELYNDGVRMVALTWNYENSLGYPNDPPYTISSKGLKPFGIEAVRRMNELGIIVDVSHLSDGGFYDVVQHSTKPFVASHSNARALCAVSRNLTDDMLKKLGDADGVAGLNFCSAFLDEAAWKRELPAECSTIALHARYMANKAGIEAVGLGSDFDGIENKLEFGDSAGMQQLMRELEKQFTPREIELISHKNVLRVIEANCTGGK